MSGVNVLCLADFIPMSTNDMDDLPVVARGSYNFNFDDYDDGVDPFAPSMAISSSPTDGDMVPVSRCKDLTPDKDTNSGSGTRNGDERNSSGGGDLDINDNTPKKTSPQTRLKKPSPKKPSATRSKLVKPIHRRSPPENDADLGILTPTSRSSAERDTPSPAGRPSPPKNGEPPAGVRTEAPNSLANICDAQDLSPITDKPGVEGEFAFSEDEFKPATEVFNDANSWDILENFGRGQKGNRSNLTRESLYVRFDPLVKRNSPMIGVPVVGRQQEPLPEEETPVKHSHGISSEDDLLMMHTPPLNKPKHPATRHLQKKLMQNSAKPDDLDKIFEVQSDEDLLDDHAIASPEPWQRGYKAFCELEEPASTAGLSQDSLDDLDCPWDKEMDGRPDSPVQFDHEELLTIDERHDTRDMTSAGSGRLPPGTAPIQQEGGIVEVLKYSDVDFAKFKMDQQARILAKERDWAKREGELQAQIQEHKETIEKMTLSNEDMQKIVAEYERTVSQVIVDKAKLTSTTEENLNDAIRERNQAVDQLRTMESAFSDLHGRYEKAKIAVETLKANEEELKKCITDYQNKIKKHEQRYQLLKQHAEEKLQSANEEIDKVHKSKNSDFARVQAALKRSELQVSSLENSLQQKIQENKELTSICDDLIKQVGGE